MVSLFITKQLVSAILLLENHEQIIHQIKKSGMKASMAIKPKTHVNDKILQLCQSLDMLLVMTVEPGFGGQAMIQECLEKAKLIRSQYPELNIQVDGGVTLENISWVAESGANVIVAGTSIFKSKNPKQTIQLMRDAFPAQC